MYTGFYITEPIGNNAFSAEKRKGRSIYVPKIIEGTLDNLELGKEIVFEEYDEKGNIISFCGLKNFIKTEYCGVPIYIFDNHNHAFYFWNESIVEGKIKSGIKLIHIDEHSDMREPDVYIIIEITKLNLQDIFDYTNNILNVGNYIKPAIKSEIIGEVIKIQGEDALFEIGEKIDRLGDYILNLDIDFFSPEMSYIDYDKAKKIVINLAKKAKLITIATSPFFINQTRAIEIIKDLLA